MSDERLREAERKWKETGSVDDEARYLLERVRVGDLTRERLELAAYCGHEGASCASTPGVPPADLDSFLTAAEFDRRIERLEPSVSGSRVVVAVLERVQPKLPDGALTSWRLVIQEALGGSIEQEHLDAALEQLPPHLGHVLYAGIGGLVRHPIPGRQPGRRLAAMAEALATALDEGDFEADAALSRQGAMKMLADAVAAEALGFGHQRERSAST